MPKTSKAKKKVSKVKSKPIVKTKAKVAIKPKIVAKGPIKISKTYIPKDTEKYMCEKHKVFFRIKLQDWKKELVRANNEALYNGSMDDNSLSLIHISEPTRRRGMGDSGWSVEKK